MTSNFIAVLLFSLIGYVLGGLVGLEIGDGWNPDSIYGLLIGLLVSIGAASGLDLSDIDWS